MTAAWRVEGPWTELARSQCGVISRAQLLALGWGRADVQRALGSAGWRALGGGIYATHRGPLPPIARDWAAVLRCGTGAALVSWTALAVAGVPVPPHRLDRRHVGIPRARRVGPVPGICLHRSELHGRGVHPSALPPRHRIGEALLAAAAECERAGDAVSITLAVLSGRFARACDIAEVLAGRRGHRWGGTLSALLADVAAGVASRLELEYLRNVHRAHGLPHAEFNAPERSHGRRVYRDVRYAGLVVELDGSTHLQPWVAAEDRRRDNALVLAGERTLRFGWWDVIADPCGTAAVVAAALGVRARPCSSGCPLGR
ncbi:MAG: hypothetical protein U0Q15_10035 [Kineosporiaceae bacterium]